MHTQQITVEGERVASAELPHTTARSNAHTTPDSLHDSILALRERLNANPEIKQRLESVLFGPCGRPSSHDVRRELIGAWTDREWRQFGEKPWSQAPAWSQFKDWSEKRC